MAYKKEDLVNIMKLFSKECNGKLTIENYEQWSKNKKAPNYRTFINHFGSWNEALGKRKSKENTKSTITTREMIELSMSQYYRDKK